MTKIVYFLVEEESMEPILKAIVREIIAKEDDYKIITHEGKQDLKKSLSEKIPNLFKVPNAYVVVLHDQDSNDCKKLKKELNDIIKDKCADSQKQKYKIRIVCRELENWYFGDFDALESAFKVEIKKFENKAIYRNVDILQNAPQELIKIIPEYKNKRLKTFPKINTAIKIAPHLEISKNKNQSFKQFVSGLKTLLVANI